MKYFVSFLMLISTIWVSSCGGTATPVSAKVAKVWTIQTVSQGGVVVYPSSNNLYPGYANYKLDLSTAPTAILKEFDGNTFTGSYSVPNDNTLTLSGLTPVPTGSGGTISYTITSISDTQMILTATTASPKTGNTINVYTLVTK